MRSAFLGRFPATFRYLATSCVLSVGWACAALAQVDPAQSFYVPQSGPVAGPSEGANAVRFFHQCPNNDASAITNNSARIKVVLRTFDGTPLAGVLPADIFIQLNGGTAAQGFAGAGADSIIANGTWNVSPLCPDLRHIESDAPTDALGVTYITFAGPTPGFPGVATRDPGRKWGHYDSELPVFALGVQLQGRFTSASPLGSYVLNIRNYDIVDGLGATTDAGQYVSFRDRHALVRQLLGPYNYWLDFDANGLVNNTDLNFLLAHMNHDCAHPNSP